MSTYQPCECCNDEHRFMLKQTNDRSRDECMCRWCYTQTWAQYKSLCERAAAYREAHENRPMINMVNPAKSHKSWCAMLWTGFHVGRYCNCGAQ